ncbi:arsenate reductase/protein-tyrosine-phosphatase family protein [Ornithinicoccus halotolerans]|uniref:arsenate reductase/protein-tyrosine-phosphatase family protein n=1 Tax=Ornithinicoccus halotolerans TaxID=1748220 RepID=UPI0012967385|nr:low molecular weight phosphatase family protein [Ornithinicoccus halotolerans]
MSEGQVLVVCTGNICRSPLLERVLQHAVDERWGPGAVPVRSAGTRGLEGSPMDPQAAERLAGFGGLSAPDFVARRLTAAMVAEADLVLTATRQHRGLVARAHPRALRYAFTVLDLADLASELRPEDVAADGEDGPTWVRALVQAAAARRGMRPPLPPEAADIVDPYGRDVATYDRMAAQVREALPVLTAALTARLPVDGVGGAGVAAPVP